jgi:hypothetical protein
VGQERNDDAHQVVTAWSASIGGGFKPGDWFRHSDVHIPLVALGWILGGSALLGRTVAWPYLLLASVGAFLVYRVDRLLIPSPEDRVNAADRVDFTSRYRALLVVVALLMTIAAAWAAFHLELAWMEVSALVGLMGLVYPLRVLPGGRRPKDIPWLKTLLIAGCWVSGGVLLPALMPTRGEPVDVFALALVGIYRTLFVLPNLWVADWQDREGDACFDVIGWAGQLSEADLICWIKSAWCLAIGLLFSMAAFGLPSQLLILESVLVTGSTRHAISVCRKGTGGMAILDLWIGSPLITWLLWGGLR